MRQCTNLLIHSVKNASFQALEELATVIRNIKIKNIHRTLLNALVDPDYGTLAALETVIHTEFPCVASFYIKNHTDDCSLILFKS